MRRAVRRAAAFHNLLLAAAVFHNLLLLRTVVPEAVEADLLPLGRVAAGVAACGDEASRVLLRVAAAHTLRKHGSARGWQVLAQVKGTATPRLLWTL